MGSYFKLTMDVYPKKIRQELTSSPVEIDVNLSSGYASSAHDQLNIQSSYANRPRHVIHQSDILLDVENDRQAVEEFKPV